MSHLPPGAVLKVRVTTTAQSHKIVTSAYNHWIGRVGSDLEAIYHSEQDDQYYTWQWRRHSEIMTVASFLAMLRQEACIGYNLKVSAIAGRTTKCKWGKNMRTKDSS